MESVEPAKAQKWLLTLSVGNASHAIVILRKVTDFAVQYELAETSKFRLPLRDADPQGGCATDGNVRPRPR